MRPITGGVRSGRNVDKWKETGLTPVPAQTVKAPVIAESPVAIECRVTEVKELGSHHMFLAEVTGVSVDEQWLNEARQPGACKGGTDCVFAWRLLWAFRASWNIWMECKEKKRCQR